MIFKQNSSPAAKIKKQNSNIKFPQNQKLRVDSKLLCYSFQSNNIYFSMWNYQLLKPCVLHLIHWVGVKLPFLKMWNHLLGNLN